VALGKDLHGYFVDKIHRHQISTIKSKYTCWSVEHI
jgi:hypothetical protein